MVVAGFFSPWMGGQGVFGLRTFSGFDFARLVRDFEITAASVEARGQMTATAAAIYAVPALAVNAALLCQLAARFPPMRYGSGVALVAAGGYTAAMLSLLVVLGVVPVNRFAEVVDYPSWGFGLTLAGALILGWLGGRQLRGSPLPV